MTQLRWMDDIKLAVGNKWHQNAQYRCEWEILKNAYIQEWITKGRDENELLI